MEHMSIATTRTASRQALARPGQPVRGVIGGPALHLPEQPLIPGQVKEDDARGSLMISDPVVRPKIVKAAGSPDHCGTPHAGQITRIRPPPGTFSNVPKD